MVNHVIIIGSGLAGYNVAREFRKHDKTAQLTIVTQEAGIYYSKPLLSSALSNARALETLTLHDKVKMAQSLDATILSETTVTQIDTKTKQIQLDKPPYALSYSHLVLALGASPKSPPLSGDSDAILHINSLADYEHFRSQLTPGMRVTLLGAGLIGSEMANDLSKSGYGVNLICSSPAPLPRILPTPLGQVMIEALRQQGATVLTEDRAISIEKTKQGLATQTQGGTLLQSDLVLSAVGLSPNISLAQKAGLSIAQGIVANRFGQTSDPAIFTIGDCAEIEGKLRQFVMPIMQAAKPLGASLAGNLTPIEFPWMPVSAKTACAMTAVPPESHQKGEWEIQGQAPNLEAVYRDVTGKPIGFALVGDATAKRREYLALLES